MDIIDPFSLTDDELLAMFPAWPDVWQQMQTAPVETEAIAAHRRRAEPPTEGKSTDDLQGIVSHGD